MSPNNIINTTCCIVGGGPAGMMAGFLLARAGVDVTVIEKHADFFRDFRGDTVHPSTLELMCELGILSDFLQIEHQEVKEIGAQIDDKLYMFVDFSHLPTKCKFLVFMPQWDFLNFIAAQARRYSSFSLHMNTEATDIIEESGRIIGVRAKTQEDEIEIRSKLVIAADGRGSIIREAASMHVENIGAPMDVLWFRLSRKASDPSQTLGRVTAGKIFLTLNRGTYWQCGFVIKKGEFEQLHRAGIDNFRQNIIDVASFIADRIDELKSWDDIKLLTVKIDRLSQWHREGLLCIGDSAHAMSPIGGVGINLAIQDAVATANILWKALSKGHCTNNNLAKVQRRRSYPTKMTQHLQVFLQNNFVNPTLSPKDTSSLQFIKIMQIPPLLRRISAYFIGVGFRPEHIHSHSIK